MHLKKYSYFVVVSCNFFSYSAFLLHYVQQSMILYLYCMILTVHDYVHCKMFNTARFLTGHECIYSMILLLHDSNCVWMCYLLHDSNCLWMCYLLHDSNCVWMCYLLHDLPDHCHFACLLKNLVNFRKYQIIVMSLYIFYHSVLDIIKNLTDKISKHKFSIIKRLLSVES